MTEAAITWRKFVLSDDEKGDQIVELSWDGARVFELAYRRGKQPRASIRTYASPALAQRSHDKRVATLLRKDHYEDGTRQGPPPLVDDAEVARAEREEDRRLAREQYDEGLPRFVDAWQALGFDPLADFATQGARSATSPVVIAERCLEVARSAFGIGFYRLQQAARAGG